MRTTVRNSYTPKTGEYCNTIVVDEDAGTQYIFDSDGVWTTYTSKQQEGAPMGYVNAKMAAALELAQNYADDKDAIILQEAKDYTDTHGGGGGVSKQYVDGADAATLQSAKDYADGKDAITLQAAKDYADTHGTSGIDVSDLVTAAIMHTQISQARYDEIVQAVQNKSRFYVLELWAGTGTGVGYVVRDALASSYGNKVFVQLIDSAGITTYEINSSKLVDVTVTKFAETKANWNESNTNSPAYIQNKPTIPVITMTDTDPGEGVALAANNFIAVYQGVE